VVDPAVEREAERLAAEGCTPVLVAATLAPSGTRRSGSSAFAKATADRRSSKSGGWSDPPDHGETGTLPDVAGVIGVADTARANAASAVDSLRRLGLAVRMLTGDRTVTAAAVARSVGIDGVEAELRPADKVAAVRRAQAEGQVVAMVGDGTNDAPSLAQADIGIAMGSGTDVALDAADVALLRPDLGLLAAAIRVSRAASRVMRQNLFWAFAYNVVMIPVAAGALYPGFGVLLSPILASAAMALSSVTVVGNSLRLRTTPRQL
jgi:Cu+-exporting ATPase